MIKINTDFNEQTPDDLCWLLLYRGRDLTEQVGELGLGNGSKVILYQDEDDFEVVGTLAFRYVEFLEREAWVVSPDWATLVRR